MKFRDTVVDLEVLPTVERCRKGVRVLSLEIRNPTKP